MWVKTLPFLTVPAPETPTRHPHLSDSLPTFFTTTTPFRTLRDPQTTGLEVSNASPRTFTSDGSRTQGVTRVGGSVHAPG